MNKLGPFHSGCARLDVNRLVFHHRILYNQGLELYSLPVFKYCQSNLHSQKFGLRGFPFSETQLLQKSRADVWDHTELHRIRLAYRGAHRWLVFREKKSPKLVLKLDREVILEKIFYFLVSSFSVKEMKASRSLSFVTHTYESSVISVIFPWGDAKFSSSFSNWELIIEHFPKPGILFPKLFPCFTHSHPSGISLNHTPQKSLLCSLSNRPPFTEDLAALPPQLLRVGTMLT